MEESHGVESITLYWRPGTCARVPYVALEEIGAPFEVAVLNAFRGDMQSPEYLAINPKGRVPALKLDDWIVTENPVILRVLADRFPEANLLPAGDEKAEVEAAEMMTWFASNMHPPVGRHFFPQFFIRTDDKAAQEAVKLAARAELEAGFTLLERRLESREWLFGEWTVIDVYMLYLWWRALGAGMDAAPFPRCVDHGRRTEARPAVAKVLDREEAELARFKDEGFVPDDWPPNYAGRIPAGAIEI
jgi:glutathione S-transferase